VKRRFYLYIFLIILFSCLVINGVYADATAFWYPIENPIWRTLYIFIIFILSTTSEYGVLLLNFKIKEFERRILLKSCYKVNFITFPITQILAYIIYIYVEFYFWIYIILIELLVINVEWGLFKIEFDNLIKSFDIFSDLQRFLSLKILIGSIIANSLSFLIGLLAFIPPFLL